MIPTATNSICILNTTAYLVRFLVHFISQGFNIMGWFRHPPGVHVGWQSYLDSTIAQEVEKELNNLIVGGGLGNTSGHIFYNMSTQNGSKLEIWRIHNLISKLWHFKAFPICLYRDAVCLQCFTPTHAHMNVTTITRFAQKCSMHACMHCVATSYTVLLSGRVYFYPTHMRKG